MKDYLLGIDVGGTNIKMMIMNSNFDVLDFCTIKTNRDLGYDVISDNMIAAIDGLFIRNQILEKRILSVAMGLPGIVDKVNKKTVRLAYLQWDGFNPCQKLGEYYNAPTFIDNDASINTLGEYYFGINKSVSNVVLLTLGTGVGCGIIIDGKLFRGSRNMAAEFGHMTIVSDGGDICLCGKRGCMEAYCSGTALTRYARNRMKDDVDSVLHEYMAENGSIFDNAFIDRGVKNGDPLCIEIMDYFIKFLSIGIANIMKILNPELILIGGGISNAGEILLTPLNERMKDLLLDEMQVCPIIKAKLGSRAGMFGACAFAGLSIGLEINQNVHAFKLWQA